MLLSLLHCVLLPLVIIASLFGSICNSSSGSSNRSGSNCNSIIMISSRSSSIISSDNRSRNNSSSSSSRSTVFGLGPALCSYAMEIIEAVFVVVIVLLLLAKVELCITGQSVNK